MIVHFDIPRMGDAAHNIVYLILWYARPMCHAVCASIQASRGGVSSACRRPIGRRVGFTYHHGYDCGGCGGGGACACGCV